jgi:carboxymethylenebutenolidase
VITGKQMAAIRQVGLSTAIGELHSIVAEPSSEPRGAVIVFQEAFGLSPYLEHVCLLLAEEGWLALAPSMFRMDAGTYFAPSEVADALVAVNNMTAEGIGDILDASVTYLDTRGFDPARTGLLGFCMGGTLSFLAATEFSFGAAVTFYGGRIRSDAYGFGSLVERAPQLLSPWLGLYGDLDRGLPVAEVERLRGATSRANVPTELIRYRDADHGFHNDTRVDIYNAVAADDAWRRCLGWLNSHIQQ